MGRGRRTQWNCCPMPSPLKWWRRNRSQVEQEACDINANSCEKSKKDHTERGRIFLTLNAYDGRLHVSVREAKDLMPMNARGSANPYVKVKLIPDDNNSKVKTKTVRATLNPAWNKSFAFDISPDDNSKRVSLEVWNRRRRSRNGFMGSLSFKISEIAKGKAEGWFQLLGQEEGKLNGISVPDDMNEAIANWRKQSSDKSTVNTAVPGVNPLANQKKSKQDIGRPADFNLLTVLGRGFFGKVVLAEKKGTDELYAIKILKKDLIIRADYLKEVMLEKRILTCAQKPPFLVQLRSCFQTADRLYFVMEYVNGGNLRFRMRQHGKLKEHVVAFYGAEIAIGLFYLHGQGIIHRDLKLSNVLIDREGHIKIADFGMCKEGIIGDIKTDTFCGTADYIAPEIVLNQPYGKSVDWWAYGVVLYAMTTGKRPFSGKDKDKLYASIKENDVSYPKSMSKEAVSVCEGLLTKEASRRLGCGPSGENDIKDHAFFKRINWDKLENREVKPPYKPKIRDPRKAENFDKVFTRLPLKLSATNKDVIKNINDNAFKNFSHYNMFFKPG